MIEGMKRNGAILLLALLVAHPLMAAAPRAELPLDQPIESFPESDGIRARYWESYFAAPRATVLSRPAAVLRSGKRDFRVSSIEAKGFFYQIVQALPPGAATIPPKGAAAKGPADSPLYAQGSWILKRESSTGQLVQAKVFLRSDPGCFVRIYPDGDRSRMDLVIYGGVMNREVPLPLPFERVFASRFGDIVAWTAGTVDWQLLSPQLGMYESSRTFVAAVRARIPFLRYADDGALDAEGRPVYIASGASQTAPAGLNCSGFVKWIVDGFYHPLAGGYLDTKAMALRHSDLRSSSFAAPFEEELDPYFGLDWTRNLGVAIADAALPSRRHGLMENDVSESPFALIAAEAMATKAPAAVNGSSLYEDYPAADSDLGYEGPGLKALLYTLAIEEPGTIYLASLSRRDGQSIAGLRRHYHVAVLVPYFEENGQFRIVVFESAAETSIDSLVARVGKDFVHLVRVQILPDFDPPMLP